MVTLPKTDLPETLPDNIDLHLENRELFGCGTRWLKEAVRFAGQAVAATLRPNTILAPPEDTGWNNDREWLKGMGIELVIDIPVHEISTTTIIEKIRNDG